MERSRSKLDVVDRLDAVGRFLRRHPFLFLAVAAEAACLLVGLGWLPRPIALVFGVPAYAVHSLTAALFGPADVPALAGLLVIALFMDLLWRRLLRLADPAPPPRPVTAVDGGDARMDGCSGSVPQPARQT